MLFGFDSCADASRCVAAIIGAGIVPVAMEYMDKPAIAICENFAHAGYPLDVEAMLIVEVEGGEAEMAAELGRIAAIAKAHGVRVIRELMSAMESAQIWKGRKSAFGATGRVADYICMDGTVPTSRLPEALERVGEICAAYGLSVANVFHAGDGNMHPLILYDVNDPEQQQKAEQAGMEVLEDERRARRQPDRRAWRRHREARPDAVPIQSRRPRPAEAGARRFRSAGAAQPGQGLPARGERGVMVEEAGALAPADEAEACAMVAEARGRGESARHRRRRLARRTWPAAGRHAPAVERAARRYRVP